MERTLDNTLEARYVLTPSVCFVCMYVCVCTVVSPRSEALSVNAG